MIDIHSHILPGIDDGSSTLEESKGMIINAINNGVKAIIATPHYIYRSDYDADNAKKKKLLKELKEYVSDLDIELYLGNEVFIDNDLVELEDAFYSLNDTRYLLLELPMNTEIKNLKALIFNLQVNDYKIILAHPERYDFIQKDVKKIMPILDSGVLLQGNMGSLFGDYGKGAKKALKIMIKHKMIHFLASDSHSNNDKRYDYFSKLNKVLDKKTIELLTKINPSKVLKNENIKEKYIFIQKNRLFRKNKFN